MAKKNGSDPRGRPAKDVPLNSPGGRLRTLRGDRPQQWLADHLNIDRSMITRYESGKYDMGPEILKRAGHLFRVAPAFILFGDEGALSIPLISFVSAGQFLDPDTQLPIETESIEVGGLEPGDYFATKVLGDSMDRISPDGSTIIVNRADREARRGRRYIFARRGETTYKRYEDQPMLMLEPESTNPRHKPLFPKDEEEWQIIGRVRLTLLEI